MSKINDLIKELCPNGVIYKKYGDVFEIKTGKGITTKEATDDGLYPIISGGTTPMGYYHSYNRDENIVTVSRVGANAGYVNFITEKFYLNDKCFSIIPKDEFVKCFIPKYIYHYTKNIENKIMELQSEGGVPTINTQKVSNLLMPMLPIDVQLEIITILDKFGELETELEAELEARKSQYEFWCGKLFDFENNVEELSLEELCNIVDYRGKTPKKVDSGIFLVTAKNIKMGYIDYDYSKEYIDESDFENVMRRGKANIGDVLFTTEAPCGHVAQVDKPNIALAQRVIKYSSRNLSKLSNEYLKYALLSNQFQNKLSETSTGTTVKGIKGSKLHTMTIPVPSIEIQNHIVSILESFDTLINDITDGLPAEIELRRKQYEYYRNKLLSFKEI